MPTEVILDVDDNTKSASSRCDTHACPRAAPGLGAILVDAHGALALRGERERVLRLASAYQLVSYAGIVRGLEPANRYQLSDGVRDFSDLLNARVP